MCPTLKKLSNNLQPYGEVAELILDVLFVKKVNDVRILEHLLLYAEYQFGNAVSGIDYRERKDGQRISNWEVDVVLYRIINSIASILGKNESQLSSKIKNDKMFPYYEKSVSLLSPWLVYFDSNISSQTDLGKNIEMLLQELHTMENGMAVVTMDRNQFDASEQHCQRSVTYSRRIGVEGEKKTTSISRALRTYVNLRQHQGDLSGAVSFAEEAYNLVVEAYDPVHPQVQNAASTLIYGLILQGDLENAERFAEQTYNNLRDHKNGMDQEGDEMAIGAFNFANVIWQQDGDIIKAEKIARESFRIICQLCGTDDCNGKMGRHGLLLARILQKQGKFGDETKELFERALAIFIFNEGSEGMNAAVGNMAIGHFHYYRTLSQSGGGARRDLLIAKSYAEEALRIEKNIHTPSHGNYIAAVELISLASKKL
jgi:tetratricopeptide (TPR) repeat protein